MQGIDRRLVLSFENNLAGGALLVRGKQLIVRITLEIGSHLLMLSFCFNTEIEAFVLIVSHRLAF